MKKILIVAATFLPLLFTGCYYDNFGEINPNIDNTCTVPDTVSFSKDVKKILDTSCGTSDGGCHSSGTSRSFDNYSSVISTFTNASSEDRSVLKRIKHDPSLSSSLWMPSSTVKIDTCNINKIEKWITQGQQNN